MWSVKKTWNNRKEAKRLPLPTLNGRTWSRRIQWLEDGSNLVKFKFDDGLDYQEVGIPIAFAQTVWDRFKSGQSIEDSVSIYGDRVQLSRKGKQCKH